MPNCQWTGALLEFGVGGPFQGAFGNQGLFYACSWHRDLGVLTPVPEMDVKASCGQNKEAVPEGFYIFKWPLTFQQEGGVKKVTHCRPKLWLGLLPKALAPKQVREGQLDQEGFPIFPSHFPSGWPEEVQTCRGPLVR